MIFSEKFIIGESGDFLWIFVFVWEESGLDCWLIFGLCDGESVDFIMVLRYWVRY